MTAYKGEKQWAPCFHSKDHGKDETAEAEYIESVLVSVGWPKAKTDKPYGLEQLLFAIGFDGWYCGALHHADLKFGFYGDQWVGVSVEVAVEGQETVYLWTEADSYALAVAKTIERLKDGGFWTEPPVNDDDE